MALAVEMRESQGFENLRSSSVGEIYAMSGNMSYEMESFVLNRASKKDKVLIAPVAGTHPKDTFESYRRHFSRRGVDTQPLYREECDDPDWAAYRIRNANHLFLTGGNQLFIFQHMSDPRIRDEIVNQFHRGELNIWAESAGSAALSELSVYSYGGLEDDNPVIDKLARDAAVKVWDHPDGVRTDLLLKGLGIIPNTIIDTHFSEADRLPRLAAAVKEYPNMIGIGKDENTGVHITGGEHFEVFGDGNVYVVYPANHGSSNIRVVPLRDGDSFNTRTRQISVKNGDFFF